MIFSNPNPNNLILITFFLCEFQTCLLLDSLHQIAHKLLVGLSHVLSARFSLKTYDVLLLTLNTYNVVCHQVNSPNCNMNVVLPGNRRAPPRPSTWTRAHQDGCQHPPAPPPPALGQAPGGPSCQPPACSPCSNWWDSAIVLSWQDKDPEMALLNARQQNASQSL